MTSKAEKTSDTMAKILVLIMLIALLSDISAAYRMWLQGGCVIAFVVVLVLWVKVNGHKD